MFKGIRSDFEFSQFFMIILLANRIHVAQNGIPRFVASYLGLYCYAFVHKRTPGLHVHVYELTDRLEINQGQSIKFHCNNLETGFLFKHNLSSKYMYILIRNEEANIYLVL